MRLHRLRVRHYGAIAELDTGEEPLGSLVVLRGENEAGKSTLFDAVVTLFFGFRPAQRDLHPYAPWTGGDPRIQAEVEFGPGRSGRVTRELRSRAEGHWEVGHETHDLGNQALPSAARVGQSTFETIFALRLERLRALDGRSWESVLELLLTGLGAHDLGSIHDAIQGLETDANRLWRADRRGKPKARVLEGEIRDYDELRRGALARQRREWELRARSEQIQQELQSHREEESRRSERIRSLQRWLPLIQRTQSIQEARLVAGDVEELRELPASPAQRLHDLERAGAALDTQIDAKEKRRAELHDVIRSFDDEDRAWLTRADAEDAFRSSLTHWWEAQRELRLAGDARSRSESEWEKTCESAGVTEDAETWLAATPESRRSPEARAHASVWVWMILASAGAAVLGWAIHSGTGFGVWVGATLLGTAAGTALVKARRAVGRRAERRDLEARLTGPAASVQAARDHEQRVANGCETARILALREAEALGLEIDPHDPDRALAMLRERVSAAQRRETRAESAQDENEHIERDLERLVHEQRQLELELESLTEALRRVDPDPAKAARAVDRRRDAAQKAVRLEESLIQEFPDLAQRRDEIDDARKLGVVIDAAELERLHAEVERHRREQEQRLGELQRLDVEMTALRDSPQLSEIEGEIERRRTELEQVQIERDRSIVLASVLREAERSFRASHQADILRRASEMLEFISGQRYSQLLLAEDGVNLDVLETREQRKTRLGSPLSQGLRDQAFFALRLAIAEHLDDGEFRLPLLVDEAFVNWDAPRRARGLELLETVSRQRQVFYFTFDEVPPQFATARVIDLATSLDYA